MTSGGELDRRSFLVGASAAGGGLALGFAVPTGPKPVRAAAGSPEITCWVVISPDDRVTIRVARSEMGQGASTGLAMLVAEELECDWARSALNSCRRRRTAPRPGLGRHVDWRQPLDRSSQHDLRRAGATAREMLIAAAAARWNVPAAQCTRATGTITHRPSGRTLTFGAVADAAAKIAPPRDVKLKDPERVEAHRHPAQATRCVRQGHGASRSMRSTCGCRTCFTPPSCNARCFRGRLKSVDESSIAGNERRAPRRANAGCRGRGGGLLVAGQDARPRRCGSPGTTAATARFPPTPSANSCAAALTPATPQVGRADGDVAAGLARAVQRDRGGLRGAVSRARHHGAADLHRARQARRSRDLGSDPGPRDRDRDRRSRRGRASEQGRGSQDDARRRLRPAWRNSGIHPAGRSHRQGGGTARQARVDARGGHPARFLSAVRDGAPVGRPRCRRHADRVDDPARRTVHSWPRSCPVSAQASSTGVLSAVSPRKCPTTCRTISSITSCAKHPCRLASGARSITRRTPTTRSASSTRWRTPQEWTHIIPAAAVAQQPKESRGARRCGEKGGLGRAAAAGVFRGIALNEACGSYCAQVVEASVDDGSVRVHRVVSAIDCGHVVNPALGRNADRGRASSMLTAALYGEITIKDGAAEQSNFNDYEMIRMAEMPKVETVIVPSGGFWSGVGEPPVPPLAPALCNAVFAATGKRIRSLPLKHQIYARRSNRA